MEAALNLPYTPISVSHSYILSLQTQSIWIAWPCRFRNLCSHTRCGACVLWSRRPPCVLYILIWLQYITVRKKILCQCSIQPTHLFFLRLENFYILDKRWPAPHQVWIIGYDDPRTIDCQRPDPHLHTSLIPSYPTQSHSSYEFPLDSSLSFPYIHTMVVRTVKSYNLARYAK